jgi:RNA polymerase sigma factor (TIGR02999 family)
MEQSAAQHVTETLTTLAGGDSSAASRLMPLVYDELRRLAASYFKGQPGNHTLQPTALVHEAFMRLVDQTSAQWNDRVHFFAVAATAMRQILVSHARKRNAGKRGGGRRAVRLDNTPGPVIELDDDLIALDESLTHLAELDERKARVVEAKFFGGLNHEEIALVMGISRSTVEADWRFARAWLADAMGEDGDS